MKCSKCDSKSVYDSPCLCKKHFVNYFEDKFKKTIAQHSLFKKNDKICVAVSGGKDSMVLLYLLKKLGYNVSVLAIDEGIKGYRSKTLDFLKDFCKKNKVKLKIVSFKDEFGKNLDDIKTSGPRCNECGTFRRFLLNKYSRGFDKITTGHNLDDEAQAVLMNLLKAQTDLFERQGPITEKIKGFTVKTKPLYFIKEKEILTYAFLLNLNVPYAECPYAHESFRAQVRDVLNKKEQLSRGSKINIVKKYLDLKKEKKDLKIDKSKDSSLHKCGVCGFPSSNFVCKACRLKQEINSV